ncbi:putative transmembrane protein [Beutenbergia cavernae DSM 12333]|uniref:Putative transmembrane protein n=1 Tax=Beutenbergia cavernae (strain ATCC BAA-8 / DSM 12333 / CCUG 43141 / JCM 11478 / NBRC 16432 / NCIMB 13614 / HKI 0122) TaxID=471853 RepID=C5BY75_BEUC1|nr:DUF3054 domain-containing protein [Beutenbergia cavernae]ACQ80975.1 putative transmembrane protein [Beutenbergia cavernae DSM 12333]
MSTPPHAASGVAVARGAVALAAALDVVCVLVFVVAGRRTHAEAGTLVGTLEVAWPFLAGLGLGWLLSRAWRAPLRPIPTGVVIWAATLLAGLALRGLSGGGLALPFVLVATAVLAVLVIGWRLVAAAVVRRRPGAAAP